MIHKSNKRGVSDVITTVLIILLVLAAVAIIGGILLRNIGDAGSKIGTQTACLDLDVKPVKCTKATPTSTTAIVLVSRGGRGSDAVISDLTLLFEDTSSKAVTTVVGSATTPAYISGSLKALQTNLYSAAVPASNLNVRTAATITGSDGRKVVCEPSTVRVDCGP